MLNEFDVGGEVGYGSGMDDDDRQMLRGIIAHCSGRLDESTRPAGGRFPPEPEARARAYARVMRAARELLEEMEG